MTAFDDGWICTACWGPNRAEDGSCYRCHAKRPVYRGVAVATVSKTSAAVDAQPVLTVVPTAEAPSVERSSKRETRVRAHSYCITCGEALRDRARFCTKCGTRTADSQESTVAASPPMVGRPALKVPLPTPSVRRLLASATRALDPRPLGAAVRGTAGRVLAAPQSLARAIRAHARVTLGASWLAVAVMCSLALYNYARLAAATPASVTAVLLTVASLGLFTALTTVVTAALLFRTLRER